VSSRVRVRVWDW